MDYNHRPATRPLWGAFQAPRPPPAQKASEATNQRRLNINRCSVLLPIISLLTNGEPEGRSGPSWYPRGGRSSSVARTNEQNGMGLEEAERRWPAQGGAEPWLTLLSASVRSGETFVQLSIKVTWAREKRWLLLLLLLPWLHLQNWVLVAWWRQNKKGGGGGEPGG